MTSYQTLSDKYKRILMDIVIKPTPGQKKQCKNGFSSVYGAVYLGMGNYMMICKSYRRRRDEKNYYFAEIGGSNGYEVEDNKNAFLNLDENGVKWYTLEEIVKASMEETGHSDESEEELENEEESNYYREYEDYWIAEDDNWENPNPNELKFECIAIMLATLFVGSILYYFL